MCNEAGDHGHEVAWQEAHEQLVRLARTRAGLDFDEGRWLLAALRSSVHARLGYGSFVEYVERLLGYLPRLTQDKLRVAEALESLPELGQALREGKTRWSALRELTRVATPETEGEWLAAAQGKTVREVEQLVSGHRPGSRPSEPADGGATRHVLRFEVSGEVLATFRDAMGRLRRDAGERLDDDVALLLMARHVLEGPGDEGRSSYQIVLTVCESCQQAQQQGCGQPIAVGPEVIEMAACDAQSIGNVQTHVGAPARATQHIPPAVRRAVLRRDGGRCVFPGCRHGTFVDVHHIELRIAGGAHTLENLVTVCSAHHRAIHRGTVSIAGSVASGLRFQHADGSSYGAVVSAAAVDRREKAFRALRGLGFSEPEARRALTDAMTHVGDEPSVELLVRRCLTTLTSRYAQAS